MIGLVALKFNNAQYIQAPKVNLEFKLVWRRVNNGA